MAIIRFWDKPFRHNPWTDFERMRREMDRLSRDYTHEPYMQSRATVYPAMNISEDADNIYVQAEIPGVDPKALKISVEGETLNLEGERKAEVISEKHSFHRREIEHGSFNRAITLPNRINIDKVEAKAVDGIILITLPKAEEVKPKTISVKVA